MDLEVKKEALSILSLAMLKIVNNYSENALLINSCFIAIDRYKTITNTIGLSTTKNILSELRLDFEIDVQYSNEDLVNKYTIDVQNIIFQNYIVVSISLVDAMLEDLYEFFIKYDDSNILDTEIENRIRNSWMNNNLVTFLSNPNKINLQKPINMKTEFKEAFIRYSELRIIRHSILHTNGRISDKNFKKLQSYENETPQERKHFAMINSPLFNEDKEIILTINHVSSIRKYLNDFLMYLYKSISEK